MTSRHDTLHATWSPGQTWEVLFEGCLQWVPCGNHGRAQPRWDEHAQYRQRLVDPPPVLLMRTHVADAVVIAPPHRR